MERPPARAPARLAICSANPTITRHRRLQAPESWPRCAPVSTNPAANIVTGSSVTLTNLAVTPLNPLMTQSQAAISDTQVNADAYLVPGTEDLLEDHLGESTMPALTHEPQPATNNPLLSGIFQPRFPVITAGRSLVSNVSTNSGIAFVDEMGANQSSASIDFVEPFQPTVPVDVPQSQPAAPQAEPTAPSGAGGQANPQAGPPPASETAPSASPAAGGRRHKEFRRAGKARRRQVDRRQAPAWILGRTTATPISRSLWA